MISSCGLLLAGSDLHQRVKLSSNRSRKVISFGYAGYLQSARREYAQSVSRRFRDHLRDRRHLLLICSCLLFCSDSYVMNSFWVRFEIRRGFQHMCAYSSLFFQFVEGKSSQFMIV